MRDGDNKNNIEEIEFKLSMILTKEEMDRISYRKEGNNEVVLKADLHEMKYKQAYRFVKNLIALSQGVFELDLVHGHNHGTVLRDMIHNDLNSPRIKSKTLLWWNEGETLVAIN
ncbi:Smr/MutS family protein [Butyrivibrio sp. MB2005]|uniref:Smr/MutS family protein n=1 Tax=Butyrivibrio sp. MB2005 TaxID=1280678 RepID=UPI0004048136|nr:Smr/MutS family protein [Butyrivibrio sp. MB2005]